MSRFYASVSNHRSTITKCGHKDGLSAHIRGWHLGIRIILRVNEKGQDEICIYKTTGSAGSSFNDILLKHFTK